MAVIEDIGKGSRFVLDSGSAEPLDPGSLEKKILSAGRRIMRVKTTGGSETVGRCGRKPYGGSDPFLLSDTVEVTLWRGPDAQTRASIPPGSVTDILPLHTVSLVEVPEPASLVEQP